jgi:Zn-dependent peptidase ImmA (M78 family)/plasmid maintenance system antidote protein VapI
MNPRKSFQPDWVSPPGATIGELLAMRQLDLLSFANQIHESEENVRALLDGRFPITLKTARQLSSCLGGSVEFWMCREAHYREDFDRVYGGQADWLNELPIADMTKLRWIPASSKPSETVEACLRFFEVSSVPAWRNSYTKLLAQTALKTSRTYRNDPGALAAWLRQGEIEAHRLCCGPWNAEGFRCALDLARKLTREKDPARFLPKLERICAKHGVAFVILRAPKGMRANGATRFVSRDRALMMLSFRYLSDDHFWFSFFHEAGHLLLHGEREIFIEGLDSADSQAEAEANDFAAKILIPRESENALSDLPLQARAIIRFAKEIGVSPGVVVGQLHHRGLLPHRQMNHLRRRYAWRD